MYARLDRGGRLDFRLDFLDSILIDSQSLDGTTQVPSFDQLYVYLESSRSKHATSAKRAKSRAWQPWRPLPRGHRTAGTPESLLFSTFSLPVAALVFRPLRSAHEVRIRPSFARIAAHPPKSLYPGVTCLMLGSMLASTLPVAQARAPINRP